MNESAKEITLATSAEKMREVEDLLREEPSGRGSSPPNYWVPIGPQWRMAMVSVGFDQSSNRLNPQDSFISDLTHLVRYVQQTEPGCGEAGRGRRKLHGPRRWMILAREQHNLTVPPASRRDPCIPCHRKWRHPVEKLLQICPDNCGT